MKIRKLTYWHTIVATLLLLLATSCGDTAEVKEFNIVPEPAYMLQKGRTFTITRSTKVCFENLTQNDITVKYITKTFRKKGIRPALIRRPKKNSITFTLNKKANTAIGDEGYLIQVCPDGILVSANTEAGIFYAFRTFVQMLPTDINSGNYKKITIPECTILDYPRYSWRGGHLDCCRHFYSVKQIERYLELMAAYKLNKFHWHLADDQGWRIEIDQYPQLNDIGSWRADSNDPLSAHQGEEATYGGFYSHADIQEIVKFAAERHIEVIPEIDLVGHCSAILAAYPELSCDGGPYKVSLYSEWPSRAQLCMGNPESMEFLTTILNEITRLFPSPYIHIGVNESSLENWESCAKCHSKMNQLGLNSETSLQGWLINEIESILAAQGKKILGWDNLVEYSVTSQKALVQATSEATILKGAFQGKDIIASVPEYCNLDTYQSDSTYHPKAAPQYLSLQKAYMYEPEPFGLTHDVKHHLLGAEAILWTDNLTTYDQVEYALLPRLCALAECFWSQPEQKSWTRFRQKIEYHKERLTSYGHQFCPGSFKPTVTATPDGQTIIVELATETANTYIYYTTDGSDPTPESAIYQQPLRLKHGTTLRTITLYHGKMNEGIYTFQI